MMRAWIEIGAVAGLVALLAACQDRGGGLTSPWMPPPGSPAFSDGYVDGCASGYADANRPGFGHNYRRDTSRYGSDFDYKDGWDKGLAVCYEDELRHPVVGGGTR